MNGLDYVALSGRAKIKAGKTSKGIKVIPQGNLEGAARKAIRIALAPGGGYAVGAQNYVKIVILNQ